MRARFTRGHRPDRHRGEGYRRVLLQEGKLVLDSDVAASVDAADALVRGTVRLAAGRAGSPDRGYLVTPGRLLWLGDRFGAVPAGGVSPLLRVHRDHARRYLGRHPSLHLDARDGAGEVVLPLEHEAGGAVRLWAWIPAGVTLKVKPGTGTEPFVAFAGSTAAEFARQQLTVAAHTTALTLRLEAGEAWIGLVVQHDGAQARPFWVAGGRYHVDGLEVSADVGSEDARAYPEVSFPYASGDPIPGLAGAEPGDRYVAYLEAWERLVTGVEAGGIVEQALGGADTTVRTRALGQVKVAPCEADPAKIVQAFASPDRGSGTLEVEIPKGEQGQGPCDLLATGGYAGGENRLYRFEVHVAGTLGKAALKWSRSNGADLFGAKLEAGSSGGVTRLRVAPTAGLQDGDLVELLGERIDLGDDEPGKVTADARFVPSRRGVGRLCQVVSVAGEAGVFTMRAFTPAVPGASAPGGAGAGVTLTEAELGPPCKVRRWDGALLTKSGTPTYPLADDGLTLRLGGTFQVGDYWQYEARIVRDNANGAWKKTPHGPERLHVPLAVLRHEAPGFPLVLEAWLDRRFAPLDDLQADDVAYDGGKVGSPAANVQEALDDALARLDGGCCDATIGPGGTGDDDRLRIQAALDVLRPDGGVLCLRAGTYRFDGTPIRLAGKRWELRGCPGALLLSQHQGPMFVLDEGARLTLTDLTLFGPSPSREVALVQLLAPDAQLVASRCGFVSTTAAVRAGQAAPVPPPEEVYAPEQLEAVPAVSGSQAVELDECVIVAQRGVEAGDLARLALRRTVVLVRERGVAALDVGELRLEEAVLDVRLPAAVRTELGSVTPELLDARVEGYLAAAASAPIGEGGVGLYARQVAAGAVRDCRVHAASAIRIGRACRMVLAGGELHGETGVRMNLALEVSLEAAAIDAQRIGILVPSVAAALAVDRCEVRGGSAGIALAAGVTAQGPEVASLFLVRVQGCVIQGNTLGVLLGSSGASPTVGSFAGVDVCENFVSAPAGTGILVSRPPLDAAVMAAHEVRIACNRIVAGRSGVHVRAGLAEISGNSVDLQGTDLVAATGIVLEGTRAAVVRENRVVAKALALKPAQAAPAARMGIRIVDGDRAVVAGNAVHRAIGLSVARHPSLVASGNAFEGGAALDDAPGAVLRDNVIGSALQVTGSQDVTVDGNTVGSERGTLAVEGLAGACRATANRVHGELRLRPRVRPLWWHHLVLAIPGLEELSLPDPTALRDLPLPVPLPDPVQETEAPGAAPAAPVAATVATRAAATATPAAPAASAAGKAGAAVRFVAPSAYVAAADAGAWRLATASAVSRIVAEEIEKVRPLLPDFRLLSAEDEFHAQVEGNWATNLRVGFASPLETDQTEERREPSPSTAVQVVANRADERLVVNRYAHAVVFHNQATTFIGASTDLVGSNAGDPGPGTRPPTAQPPVHQNNGTL